MERDASFNVKIKTEHDETNYCIPVKPERILFDDEDFSEELPSFWRGKFEDLDYQDQAECSSPSLPDITLPSVEQLSSEQWCSSKTAPQDSSGCASAESPDSGKSPNPGESPNSAESPNPEESPNSAESPNPEESPNSAESPNPVESPNSAKCPNSAESPNPEESPNSAESPNPEESPNSAKSPNPEESPNSAKSPSKIPYFHCAACNCSFARREFWKEHFFEHHAARKRKSCTCAQPRFPSPPPQVMEGKRFSLETSPGKQDNDEEFRAKYSAPLCENTQHSSRKSFSKQKHSSHKTFQCTQCSFKSSRKQDCDRHYLSKHALNKPLACSHCDYTCVLGRQLRIHISSKHTICKAYLCTLCRYSYYRKQHLTRHFYSKHSSVH
ncbi:telomere zinc finger-associated protein isoform X2 [Hyalella azteca]|uniref:Protein hunchback n=1 Tax=Hyalella azteca TaxID=294128 RepID=A0A979FXA3_HYAAZ|nr:telomere zinc finger-associated protein isoform X2 [Hyalella azteca]